MKGFFLNVCRVCERAPPTAAPQPLVHWNLNLSPLTALSSDPPPSTSLDSFFPWPLLKLQPLSGSVHPHSLSPWHPGWGKPKSGSLCKDWGRAAHFTAYPWSFSLPGARTACYSDTILILSDRNIPFWETKPSRAENEKDTKPRLSRKAFIRNQYNTDPSGTRSGSRSQTQAWLRFVKLRSFPDQSQADSSSPI